MGEVEPYIDPGTEINAKELVVQDGEDIGRVAAVDTHQAEPSQPFYYRTDVGPQVPDTSRPWPAPAPSVEGLPVIGADAEDEKRDDLANLQPNLAGSTDEIALHELTTDQEGNPTDISLDQAKDIIADRAGEEAMIKAVGDRAEAQVAGASPELVKQVRDAAEFALRSEFNAKREEKAKMEQQIAADDKAREILEKLQSGLPVDEVLPPNTTVETAQPEPTVASTETDSPAETAPIPPVANDLEAQAEEIASTVEGSEATPLSPQDITPGIAQTPETPYNAVAHSSMGSGELTQAPVQPTAESIGDL